MAGNRSNTVKMYTSDIPQRSPRRAQAKAIMESPTISLDSSPLISDTSSYARGESSDESFFFTESHPKHLVLEADDMDEWLEDFDGDILKVDEVVTVVEIHQDDRKRKTLSYIEISSG